MPNAPIHRCQPSWSICSPPRHRVESLVSYPTGARLLATCAACGTPCRPSIKCPPCAATIRLCSPRSLTSRLCAGCTRSRCARPRPWAYAGSWPATLAQNPSGRRVPSTSTRLPGARGLGPSSMPSTRSSAWSRLHISAWRWTACASASCPDLTPLPSGWSDRLTACPSAGGVMELMSICRLGPRVGH